MMSLHGVLLTGEFSRPRIVNSLKQRRIALGLALARIPHQLSKNHREELPFDVEEDRSYMINLGELYQ